MIKLAIFDFDGTLCSTHAAIAHTMAATFEAHGRPVPDAAAIGAVIQAGLVIAEAFTVLHADALAPAEAQNWALTYRRLYDGGEGLARTVMFPGVIEGLARLAARGVALVVLSNKGEQAVWQALRHFEIADHFRQVIGDRPGIAKKPDPAAFREVIAPAFPDILSEETAMVGDTAADLGFAHAIGAKACWARYGFGDPEACMALRPDLIVDGFAELVPLLGG